MNIVFTIVAKNYIGLAKVLAKSVIDKDKSVLFYIFIADEPDMVDLQEDKNIRYIVCKDELNVPEELWNDLSFKYNLTEFCTAIKPLCFQYLSKDIASFSKLIYFDPDILVYSSLNPIYEDLENNFVVLTPHILTIQENFTGQINDQSFLGSGIFNLGFLAIKVCSESEKLINWWTNRLMDKCYIDLSNHLFTDQKWMNFVPSLFQEGVKISNDLGRNIAPWNFFERKIVVRNNDLYVVNRISSTIEDKLIFAHFSGFNYKNILAKEHSIIRFENGNFEDLDIIFSIYASNLEEGDIPKYLSLKYTYNYFDNGDFIIAFYRRIYRRLKEMNDIPFNPFSHKELFFQTLKRKKLMLNSSDSSFDKTNINAIEDFSSKIKTFNFFFKIVKSLIGIKRYILLCRFLERYFKYENQIHLFDAKLGVKGFKKN
jgi:hypothetical protein